MLEWKIEEAAQFFRYLAIEAPNDGASSNSACYGISGEGACVTAEHIARELVKQDNER